jgi:hypothetical protein
MSAALVGDVLDPDLAAAALAVLVDKCEAAGYVVVLVALLRCYVV